MRVLDIVLLVLIGIGAYGGYKRGFVVELVRTVSWFIALIASFMLLDLGMSILEPILGKSWFLPRITYFCIFVGTIWGLTLFAKYIKQNIKQTLLGDFDTWAGGVLGTLKVIVIVSAVFAIAKKLNYEPAVRSEGKQLYVFPLVKPVAPICAKFIMSIVPPVSVLKSSIETRFGFKL